MDEIDKIRKEKYVGIVINPKADMFSNGMIQNAFFIYDCLKNGGTLCKFLSTNPVSSPFNYKDATIEHITSNMNSFHTVILASGIISNEMYNDLKKHKVNVVAFLCGNIFAFDIDNFCRGPIGDISTFFGRNVPMDEMWIIPSYKFMIDYMETMTGKKGFVVPHLWSPGIIQENLKNKEQNLFFQIANRKQKKIEIVVLEANTHYFKSACLPIIAGEKLFHQQPDLIENVYCFNWPNNSHSELFANNLTLGKKFRKFQRLPLIDILTHFNKKDTFPIFVSHQIGIGLNYLFYELLYYGYPLVHNSTDLENCGYYYPEHDVKECVNQILDAFKNHSKNIDTYKQRNVDYLERVNPANKDIISIWQQLINDSIHSGLNIYNHKTE
jgi:hypothetical protein